MMKHQQIGFWCHEEGIGLSPDVRKFHQIDAWGWGIHDGAHLPAPQAFLGTILNQVRILAIVITGSGDRDHPVLT